MADRDPPPPSPEAAKPVRQPEADFSLVLGGPFYRLLLGTRLVHPPLRLLPRRVLVLTALAWLPLFALTVFDGSAVAGVALPFLNDLETYARFLVGLPLLLIAEINVQARLPHTIAQFRERGLIEDVALPQFDAAIASAVRLRNSAMAEVVLLAFVFVVGPWLWHNGLALPKDTWYAHAGDGGIELTRAGGWMVYVSAPLFQFLLLRWYWRIFIWWRFLWQVSRLPLHLAAVHPDRAGGLGFLGDATLSFMTVLFAQGAVLSGIIATRVLFGGASALAFRPEIALVVTILVLIVVLPLLFFSPDLLAAQRDGMRRYGTLAAAYARDFEKKWLGARRPENEELLGHADFQSLNDLAGAGDIVSEMRMVPFPPRTLVFLALAAAAPFFPLVLTVIPLADLLQEAVQMLL